MDFGISNEKLETGGLSSDEAKQLIDQLNQQSKSFNSRELAWQHLSQNLLNKYPFDVQLAIFSSVYPDWLEHQEIAPAWLPNKETIATANISKFMHELQFDDVKKLHQWSCDQYEAFWSAMVKKLNIRFDVQPQSICDLSAGIEAPSWFPDSKLNIVNSCFTAPENAVAIIYQDNQKLFHRLTYRELNELSNQIANSLLKQGFTSGDSIGIAMPMNMYAVAIYLGIIKMGGVVVSIADSFSTQEIFTRLEIAKAKAIFTQDFSIWGGKKLPLYAKIRTESTPANLKVLVLPCMESVAVELHALDIAWKDFLLPNKDLMPVACTPMTPMNILFSSGTTGVPKAIVWNHTTAIKVCSDAFLHQNIQANDVLSWPTNLGWMMGPWLIFAALMNHATIALYHEAPKDRGFGEFIQDAKVTMLGVVPTLVANWRQSKCMEGLNWQAIKVFSSSGECSNPEDMLYLMSLAGYKPVIEYCGGTEIGGGYISSTVIQSNFPALFSTPTIGLNFLILDDEGHTANTGEVALIPPSIGLSTQLLNTDHYHVYFENMPKSAEGKILRRHGDQIKRYPNGYFAILGRVDDTMKLGGIKTSAAEIERSLAGITNIIEVAAIAIQPPDHGPSQLVVYAATSANLDKQSTMNEMQKRINTHLNPLFKIHDVIFVKDLPKTASNKIMRRVLRKNYSEMT